MKITLNLNPLFIFFYNSCCCAFGVGSCIGQLMGHPHPTWLSLPFNLFLTFVNGAVALLYDRFYDLDSYELSDLVPFSIER